MFEGVTVVVSPLISLMQDQVMQLQNRGIPAAFLKPYCWKYRIRRYNAAS